MTDTSIAPPPAVPRWFLPLVGSCIVALIAANNIGNVVWSCAVVSDADSNVIDVHMAGVSRGSPTTRSGC